MSETTKAKKSVERDPKNDGGLPAEPNALAGFATAALAPRRRRRVEKEEVETPPVSTAEDEAAVPSDESSPSSAPSSETSIPEQPRGDLAAAAAGEPQAPAEDAPAVVEPTAVPAQAEDQASPTREAAAPPAPVERREVAVVAASAPSPVQVTARPLPELGIRREGPSEPERRSTQCTVNVSMNVRDRFAAYQLAKKLERGSEPTNAVVVRRAVLHARKHDLFEQMLEAIRHRQAPLDEEDDDPEGLFGDVQGRRVERGRARDMAQQSFRPSYEELAVIDAMVRAYGFTDRSSFLDAALDMFLPPLQEKRRRS